MRSEGAVAAVVIALVMLVAGGIAILDRPTDPVVSETLDPRDVLTDPKYGTLRADLPRIIEGK